MERRLKPRLFEKTIASYERRMEQQDLNYKETSIVTSYAFNLEIREMTEIFLLVGLVGILSS